MPIGTLSRPLGAMNDKGNRDLDTIKRAFDELTANLNARDSITSPAQITANQDNYAPGDYGWLRLTTDAARNITGFSGGSQGRQLTVTNVGAFNIVLMEQVTSTAANQIITGTGADVTLVPLETAILKYDSVSSRWRIVGNY